MFQGIVIEFSLNEVSVETCRTLGDLVVGGE